MFEKVARKNMMIVVRAFMKATGLAMATVSRRYHGSADFLEKFARGDASPSIDTYGRMIRKLAKDWPPDAEKPALYDVPPT